MELKKAKEISLELIEKLAPKNTEFKFDNAKRRIGCCKYRKDSTIISISKCYMPQLNESEVRNVIIHEIAHVLNPRQKHNKQWRETAIQLGGDGKRVFGRKIDIGHKYKYTCPVCRRVSYKHTKRDLACGVCCNKNNNGKYDIKYKLVVELNK